MSQHETPAAPQPSGPDPLGIVAFSFGKRAASEEPNPSNMALAQVVARRIRADGNAPKLVVAQWEIAKGLRELGVQVDLVVNESADGSYLSTDDVWTAAGRFLRENEVKRVSPVAQPFLHMPMVKRMIKSDGFSVANSDIGRVEFDKSRQNMQWWTKDRPRLLVYSILRLARSAFFR